jgi:hypothetical protein
VIGIDELRTAAQPSTANESIVDPFAQLAEMNAAGALIDDEFSSAKARLLK